eukprot:COSAG02_NODE_2121_length_9774_cov_3.757003_1_plen_251_part_10
MTHISCCVMQSRFKTRSLRASNSGTFRIRRQVVQQEEAEEPLQQAMPGTASASASVIVHGIGTIEIVRGIVREIGGDHARRLRQAGTTPTGVIRSGSRAKVLRGRRCDRIHQTESGTPRHLLLRCTGVPNSGRLLKRPAGSRTGSAIGCYGSSLAAATAAGLRRSCCCCCCCRWCPWPETAIARQRISCRSFDIRLFGPNSPWLPRASVTNCGHAASRVRVATEAELSFCHLVACTNTFSVIWVQYRQRLP